MSRNYRTSVNSRERNRIHARKTRQRKKEQMHSLQGNADELKEEQVRLRQIINEKNTANILVGLFSKSMPATQNKQEDPEVEELLRRPIESIPDSSKIPELPALILPGQHASKKVKANRQELPGSDGIDYDLLGKDRSKCSPEELDQIRRERNRMHAKRTRDRKRLFMEEMAEMCRKLEEENDMLRLYLAQIDPDHEDAQIKTKSDSSLESDSTCSSPSLFALSTPKLLPLAPKIEPLEISSNPSVNPTKKVSPTKGTSFAQITTLLEAATTFEQSGSKRAFLETFSRSVSADDDDENHSSFPKELSIYKRQRLTETLGHALATSLA
jgi:hypothetical protein